MLLIILFALFIWNFILTILVCKLYSKRKKIVCSRCGCEQIAVLKQNANNSNGIVNVCQRCGNTWELSINTDLK